MNVKTKTINTQGKIPFLRRLSVYLKSGKSIKLHLIIHDDLDEPHDHPWDFKSLLLIPYKEILYKKDTQYPQFFKHFPFTIVKRNMSDKHITYLYRIFGMKIPAVTIGLYSKKKQLCSFCREKGYCISQQQK